MSDNADRDKLKAKAELKAAAGNKLAAKIVKQITKEENTEQKKGKK